MGKLVVLKLGDGSFEQGFSVTLQIGHDGDRPFTEIAGRLPPAPGISHQYSNWQSTYRSLGLLSRIKASPGFVTNISVSDDCDRAARNLRDRLNAWFNADSFRCVRDKLLEQLMPEDEIRVIVQTDDIWVRRLPWHLWELCDRYPKAEIALSAPAYERTGQASSATEIKILAILGNSEGINTKVDRVLLEQLPNAKSKFLVEPQLQEINNQLWQEKWDILFFAGHSSSQADGETGRIYINQTDSLTITELKYALRSAVKRGLKLAIFNSCDGLGLARDLAELSIPQVIVMREPVPDRIAQEFFKHFLHAFSGGQSLYSAVREARERLQGLEKEFPCATWLPVICQNPAETPLAWPKLKLVHGSYLPKVLVGSLLAASLIVVVRHWGVLQEWELKTFDWMLQLRSQVQPEDPDNRILVIEITDRDVEAQKARGEVLGDRSISDDSLSRLLTVLEKYHPRVIGLDLYRAGMPAKLVQQFSQMQNLIGVCKSRSAKNDPSGFPPPAGLPRERVGFSDFANDTDQVLRRQFLFMSQEAGSPCPGHTGYSFSSQVALHYLAAQGIKPQFTSDKNLQLGKTVFVSLDLAPGGYQQVNLGGSQILLNYRPSRVLSVPLNDVLEAPQRFASAIQDRIILIGANHTKSTDTWISPYLSAGTPQTMPGVFMQAQQISQILSSVLNNRPLLRPWVWWVEVVWISDWSLIGGWVSWRSRLLFYQILTISGVVGILYAVSFVFFIQGWWTPVVPSMLALVLTGGSTAAYQIHRQKK